MTSRARAKTDGAQGELSDLLAEVRHELAQRLETVAHVSKQLARLCDEAEATVSQREQPANPGEAPSGEARNSSLAGTLQRVAEASRASQDADWWQRVETALEEDRLARKPR